MDFNTWPRHRCHSSAVSTRTLDRYPSVAVRTRCLAVVVVVTVSLYYALYVKGSVAPAIIDEFDMSLVFYISIAIIGNLCGAFAALASGAADRIGRSGIIVRGAGAVAVLTTVLIPLAPNKIVFLALDVTQTAILGAVLAVTPALIRDFAPQLNRATAMCTWNLGPILGSLLVSGVAGRTLDDHPDWRFQFYVCGTVCALAFLLALVGIRELSPALRRQLVRSGHDPKAVDERVEDTDASVPATGGWRELVTPRLVLPAIGISLFLFFYVTRLAYWVIYFVTNFGFTAAEANRLSNWWWGTSALTLLVIGVLSDRLGVRKPLMLLGAVVSASALAVFASRAGELDTSTGTFVLVIVPAAFGGVMTFGMWLTAYSEAIEAVNPALVATGMAIYGWILRLLVAVALISVVSSVGAADTLVDHGAEVARIGATYPEAVAGMQSPDPTTAMMARGALRAADVAYLNDHAADVVGAVQDGPAQWERWWRICLVLQLLFIPTIWLLPGRWRPRRG